MLLYLVMCSLVFVTYYMDVLMYIGDTLKTERESVVCCVLDKTRTKTTIRPVSSRAVTEPMSPHCPRGLSPTPCLGGRGCMVGGPQALPLRRHTSCRAPEA